MKNFTPFRLRKTLAESLILSKIDSNDYVYSPLIQQLLKKLQRLQKAVASFVLKRYAHKKDILKFGWLPIAERRVFNQLKLTFKAIHNTNWPTVNKLELQTCNRVLRSSNETRVRPLLVPDTFEDAAAKCLSALPRLIKSQSSFMTFCSNLKKHLFEKANNKLN